MADMVVVDMGSGEVHIKKSQHYIGVLFERVY